MVFVDGSFRAGCSAWAVVVLGRRHGLWHWLGFRCGRVPPPLAGNSVYEAEIWAQIVALGIVSAADLPALILYDSQSAALTAIGATAGLSSCPLQSTLTSLTSYARQSSHPPNSGMCLPTPAIREMSWLMDSQNMHLLRSMGMTLSLPASPLMSRPAISNGYGFGAPLAAPNNGRRLMSTVVLSHATWCALRHRTCALRTATTPS